MEKFKVMQKQIQRKKYILNVPRNSNKDVKIIGNTINSKLSAISQSPSKQSYTPNSYTHSIRHSSKQLTKIATLDKIKSQNINLAKETIQKMRRFERQSTNSYQRKLFQMKKYVNNCTRICNRVKKDQTQFLEECQNYTTKEERKKFLMGQISFTEIDQSRIFAQKKYIQKFSYLTNSMSKMNESSQSSLKDNQQKLLASLKLIDRLYAIIQQMETIGYVRKKNKYVIDFCMNGRAWLKEIFLYQSEEKKDAFTLAIKYYVVGTAEEVKLSFAEYVITSHCRDVRILEEDIQGLYQHLQHALTQKKLIEINNVADYIEKKMKVKESDFAIELKLKYERSDKLQLTTDLSFIEEKFGAMQEITKVSRRRFDELNKSYIRLQTLP